MPPTPTRWRNSSPPEAMTARLDKIPAEMGLTTVRALAIIKRNPGLSPSILAGSLRMSTAAATGTIDRLVERNLITRSARPGDRRSSILSLTPEGEALAVEIFR
jgi:DNA-binding MarR family transcriptional regulator